MIAVVIGEQTVNSRQQTVNQAIGKKQSTICRLLSAVYCPLFTVSLCLNLNTQTRCETQKRTVNCPRQKGIIWSKRPKLSFSLAFAALRLDATPIKKSGNEVCSIPVGSFPGISDFFPERLIGSNYQEEADGIR
jgi:hypothetical protein